VPQLPPRTPSVSEVESTIVPAAVANPPHRHPVLLADPSKDAIASLYVAEGQKYLRISLGGYNGGGGGVESLRRVDSS
jgi:hypothetical protein